MKIFVGPIIHSIYKEEVTIVPSAATVIKDGKVSAIKFSFVYITLNESCNNK